MADLIDPGVTCFAPNKRNTFNTQLAAVEFTLREINLKERIALFEL